MTLRTGERRGLESSSSSSCCSLTPITPKQNAKHASSMSIILETRMSRCVCGHGSGVGTRWIILLPLVFAAMTHLSQASTSDILVWKDPQCGIEQDTLFLPQLVEETSSSVDVGRELLLQVRARYHNLTYSITSVVENGRRGDGHTCTKNLTDDNVFGVDTFDDDNEIFKIDPDGKDAIVQTKGQLFVTEGSSLHCDEYKMEIEAKVFLSSFRSETKSCRITMEMRTPNYPPRKLDAFGPIEDSIVLIAQRGQPFNEIVDEPFGHMFEDPNGHSLSFTFANLSEVPDETKLNNAHPFFLDACKGEVFFLCQSCLERFKV